MARKVVCSTAFPSAAGTINPKGGITTVTREKAVELLSVLLDTEVLIVDAYRTADGPSKELEGCERMAVTKIFRGLTGKKPTDREMNIIVNG
jgi:hypothetical protein